MSSSEDPFANCFSFSWTRKIVEEKNENKAKSFIFIMFFSLLSLIIQ